MRDAVWYVYGLQSMRSVAQPYGMHSHRLVTMKGWMYRLVACGGALQLCTGISE